MGLYFILRKWGVILFNFKWREMKDSKIGRGEGSLVIVSVRGE